VICADSSIALEAIQRELEEAKLRQRSDVKKAQSFPNNPPQPTLINKKKQIQNLILFVNLLELSISHLLTPKKNSQFCKMTHDQKSPLISVSSPLDS
jgi:hypothetical protein